MSFDSARCAIAVVALFAASAAAAPLHRYEVTVGDTLDRLDVRACFDGAVPQRLIAETSGARAYLETMQSNGRVLAQDDAGVTLDGLADGACVDYRVALQPVRTPAQIGGPETRRIGRDLLTSIGDWLWRPPDLAEGADIELAFRLPPGVAVSAPWQRVTGKDERPAFRLGPSSARWPGIVALGRFAEREIAVPGAVLRVAVLDGPTPAQQTQVEAWLARAAHHVAMLYGCFPVASLQVIVAPTRRGRGPAPWAYVSRGGGPAIHLFINPERPPEEFERDWTAVHEMSHLFLPYVETRDAWLFEGLPTYLQNVLMVRGGAIGAEEGWRRMVLGLQRGARVAPGLTLTQASDRIGVRGNYLRVYWAGAAMLLEADMRLREDSSGTMSLDSALAALAQCCLGQARRWSAAELTARLDTLTGTTLFSEIMKRELDNHEFPDFKRTLVRAGVTVQDGEVRLDPSAPGAAAREAVMSPAQPLLTRPPSCTQTGRD